MSNWAFLTAKKIYRGGETGKLSSLPAVRIAIIGIALGILVMTLAVSIVIGFKREVRDKICGFTSHIQIKPLTQNSQYELKSIEPPQSLLDSIASLPEVKHLQSYVMKAGLLKVSDDIQGVIVKGVEKDYDWNFFSQSLVEGTVLNTDSIASKNTLLISRLLARKLRIKLNDEVIIYYLDDNIKARKYKIVGIYETNFIDFDKNYLLTHADGIRSLNGWKKDQVSGVEIELHRFGDLTTTNDHIYDLILQQNQDETPEYYPQTVVESNPTLFDWLSFLDQNVWIILSLMLAVAGFTVISGLLIIILEKTNLIGILKALGANNRDIRKVFLYVSLFIIAQGLLWGNLLSLTFCLIQNYFGILKLDPAFYFIDKVPIDLNPLIFIGVNLLTIVTILCVMLIPTLIIARISPAKSIKFE